MVKRMLYSPIPPLALLALIPCVPWVWFTIGLLYNHDTWSDFIEVPVMTMGILWFAWVISLVVYLVVGAVVALFVWALLRDPKIGHPLLYWLWGTALSSGFLLVYGFGWLILGW